MHVSLNALLKAMQESKMRFDEKRVKEAFALTKRMHQGQKRLTGEAYYKHPLAVAIMLAQWGADQDTVIVALLHDVVEDTEQSIGEVEEKFGTDISNLVFGVTKISKGALRDKDLDRSIESLRRWFEIMQSDVRVAIIKLFDRWHNMQTLYAHHDKKKQKEIAQETLDIYARIAKKLSMYELAIELENLALPYISPRQHKELRHIQRHHTLQGERIANHVRRQLIAYDYRNKIESLDFTEVSLGTLYSDQIHKKDNLRGNLPFAYTIITPTIEDCYYILFLVHNIWKVKEESVCDYISTPSATRYQGLHTTVLFGEGIDIQFKIRTQEMQNYYLKGITRFCFTHRGIEKNFPWIRNLSYVTKIDKGHSNRFFEKLKSDVLGEYIFVYTIMDEPFLLPKRATMLDAAFYIYGEHAFHLKKAFINGEEVKPNRRLSAKAIVHFEFQKKLAQTNEWPESVVTALGVSMLMKKTGVKKRCAKKKG